MKEPESGQCEICEEAATQKCAHCGIISYCGREHQKQHWASHKNLCKPYQVQFSDVFGRYLVASRDIKPGELILREQPLVVGPRMDSVPLCLGCYRPASRSAVAPRLCSRCGVAPICSAECEDLAPHAAAECDLLARSFKVTEGEDWSLSSNLQIVMPLRCLLLKPSAEQSNTNWEDFMKLEAHSQVRQNTAVWEHHKETVVDPLKSNSVISSDEDLSEVQKICGILDVNCFELRGPNPALMTQCGRQGERLRGVYLEAALMSHDCVGNTHLSVDDNYVMTIHASIQIKAGDSILFNYASALESTPERLQRLREGKYFNCTCKRCADPTELGTYMSSIICSRCHDGMVIMGNPLQQKNTSDHWFCEKCHHRYNPKLIRATMTIAWSEIEETDNSDTRDMETLLKKFSRTFPQTNVVMVEIKQNLVALYREVILREPSPSRKTLQRKINLCLELLDVLNIIEPGISRLRGITLYELHVPKVMLANREYDSGEIPAGDLLTRLTDSETILRDAISMLLYEPTNSPEGKLLRIAIDELRVLRENIQDVKILNEQGSDDGRKGNKRKMYGKKTKK